jgi:tripartite-type tricarboxylate transporter receptor subunit TctC
MKGVEGSAWHILFAPKGTPADIIRKLNDAAVGALDTPKVQEQLAAQGATLPIKDLRSPEHARAFVKGEIERWGGTIRAMKLELN